MTETKAQLALLSAVAGKPAKNKRKRLKKLQGVLDDRITNYTHPAAAAEAHAATHAHAPATHTPTTHTHTHARAATKPAATSGVGHHLGGGASAGPATGPAPREIPASMPDYFLVLDFEATCLEGRRITPQEIIEFPTVMVEARTGRTVGVFHHYVRPQVHPVLSPFCTGLTGIAQETVEAGVELAEAMKLHWQWLLDHGLNPADPVGAPGKRFVYVTCGDWDLKTALPAELTRIGVQQAPLSMRRWVNVKKGFAATYNTKARGMAGMLRTLGLELEGRHHSGIDDCHNIARILVHMIRSGWSGE